MRSNRVAAWACVVLGTLASRGSARAETVSFYDGVSPGYTSGAVTIRSDHPSTNYYGGPPHQIQVGRVGGTAYRGLAEFNLSELVSSAGGQAYTITGVSLTFKSASGVGGVPAQYDLHQLGNNLDYDPATVTWNSAPGGAGGAVGSLLSSATVGASASALFGDSLAFRGAVADTLALDPDQTLRVMLKGVGAAGGTGVGLCGSSASAFFGDPILTVDFSVIASAAPPEAAAVPLPAVGWAGLGLFGLAGVSRVARRRAARRHE